MWLKHYNELVIDNCMDSSDGAPESSSVDAAESSADDDTSETCAEQTYGCSHYQRKCSLVVCYELQHFVC